MSDNIQVAVRIRPIISTEKSKGLKPQWTVQNNAVFQIDENGHRICEPYKFDHIFQMDKSNAEIYDAIVKEFVEFSLNGINSTIFTYGQTSSGKTYTMLGENEDVGIMSLAIENIFDLINNCSQRKFLLRVSYLEIYNEKIRDLIDPSNKDLKIRENMSGMISAQDLKEEIITSKEQIYGLLKLGTDNKYIGATEMNEKSSRSHTIFKIIIESTEKGDPIFKDRPIQVSSLNLVDLAGSERVAHTKATGKRLKEGGHINRSLSTLALVIKQLSDGNEFINFRDSKLTRLLQHSLGGNGKTLIISTITVTSIEDTHSTLSFSQRAKSVKNTPKINEILSEAAMTKRYAQLNEQLTRRLEEQLAINKNLESENAKQIRRLQEQMELLARFHDQGASRPPIMPAAKRRHTIAFQNGQRPLLQEECESSIPNQISLIANSPQKPRNSYPSKFQSVREDENNIESTPKSVLRTKYESLKKDYKELLESTRYEQSFRLKDAIHGPGENIKLGEPQRVDKEFSTSQLESKFEKRETEPLDHTSYEITRRNDLFDIEHRNENRICDSQDIDYLMKNLLALKDILSSADSNVCDNKFEKSSQIKLINTEERVKDEILQLIDSFSQVCGKMDQISLVKDCEGFNELLEEFSIAKIQRLNSFNEMNSLKDKEPLTGHIQFLLKIYEDFLLKVEMLEKSLQKILDCNFANEKFQRENEQLQMDCNIYKTRCTSLESELNDIKSRSIVNSIPEISSELTVAEEKINQLNEKNRMLQDEILKFQIGSQNLAAINATLTNQNCTLEKQYTEAFSNLKSAEERITKLVENSNNMAIEREQLKCEIARLNQELQTLNDKFEGLRDPEVEHKDYDYLRIKNKELCKELSKVKQVNDECETLNISLRKDLRNSQRIIKANDIKLSEYEESMNQLRFDLNKKIAHVNKLESDFKQIEEEIKQYECTNMKLNHEISHLKDNNRKLNENIGNLNEEIKKCKELENHKTTVATEELKHLNDKLIGQELLSKQKEDLKAQFELILCNIGEQILNDMKNLLSAKDFSEEQEYLKFVKKELKHCSESLKSVLNLCVNNNADFKEVQKIFQESVRIMQQYSISEKTFLHSKINDLNVLNKEYLSQIHHLKDSSEDCQNCLLLNKIIREKDQLIQSKESHLNETLGKLKRTQETLLMGSKTFSGSCSDCNNLKEKNSELEKKNQNQMRRIVDLQLEFYELKRKKEGKIEEIYFPQQKYNCDAEVQCDLYKSEYESLKIKCDGYKTICMKRKEEILRLQKLHAS